MTSQTHKIHSIGLPETFIDVKDFSSPSGRNRVDVHEKKHTCKTNTYITRSVQYFKSTATAVDYNIVVEKRVYA